MAEEPEVENIIVEYEGTVSPTVVFNSVWYHIRFTFSDQDEELKCLEDKQFIGKCKRIHARVIDKLRPYVDGKMTTGFEVMNKKGESCRAHFHVCFASRAVRESMRRTLVRYLHEYDQNTHGNQALSFKQWTNLREGEDAFYRYPLKQSLKPDLQVGFTQVQLETMHQIAKDSYMKVVQVNQSKQDKQDNLDTLFSRLKLEFKKSGVNTTKSLQIVAINFYIKEERPLNPQTIQGYVANYMISEGLITAEEYADKHMRQ